MQLFPYLELNNSIHIEEMSLFRNIFYQHFLGDKLDKRLKAQETQKIIKLLR